MMASPSPGEAFPPEQMTRAHGLARLEAVSARLGQVYARERNTAPGEPGAATTSMLSPWLRRRLLTEEEVVQAARAAHGPLESAKFVQEVFWRTYFKGFLEQHPLVWTRYLAGLDRAREKSGHLPDLGRAEAGRTGIGCFDAWAEELRETGWLHNHVRMWFASIWIFTLRLPWELGADFFARELIDFDPASNTLSWRWVAGLHTRGKHYIARAENIARCTKGRFDPAGQLDEHPQPLEEAEPPPRAALPRQDALPDGPYALLLHEDDFCPETLHLAARPARVAVLDLPTGPPRWRRASAAACRDAAARAAALFGDAVVLRDAGAVPGWAAGLPVVVPYAPVGKIASALSSLRATPLIRRWDADFWPHCGRGFFQLKARIPMG